MKKKTVRRKKKLTPEENKVKNSSMKPQNKYTEAFMKHQGSFTVYDPNFMVQTSSDMETTTVITKKNMKRRKKLATEESMIPNSAMPVQNKYVEAALKHQGSFIVYDPNFML